MKISKANFSEFFIKHVRAKLVIIDKERKKSQLTFLILSSAVALVWFKLFYFRFHSVFAYFLFLGVPLLTVVIIFRFSFGQYRKKYKEKIIPILFDQIFDRFEFLPERFLSEEDYRSSLLYQGQYNRFSGEDRVDAEFLGKKIRLSEILVKKVKNSSKNREERIIFKGLLIILNIDYPNSKSETIIEPDIAEKWFGHVGKMMQFDTKNHEIVRLESPEFEKNYLVRSNDQIEARKILSPLVQERLLLLSQKSKLHFAFSLSYNQIAIALPSSRNLFEPSYFTSNNQVRIFRDIVDIFLFLKELLEELKIK